MADPALDRLNGLEADDAVETFLACCGSSSWARRMAARRPFRDRDTVLAAADEVWAGLVREDVLEAFAAHPRIGDLESLTRKFASTRELCAGEQAGAAGASREVLEELARYNELYENRYGYIFIVCATGKSAQEMLDILRTRIENDPDEELAIAAAEQAKITRIRLEKL